jgi:hypothetical protein
MSHHSKKKVPRKRSVKKQKKSSKSTRKWSLKYKRSINCNKPRGFSQKQYCKKKSRQKKSRQKKSRQKKSRQKKSPRRRVKKSRRRTTAALTDSSEDVNEAAQALLAIAGIKETEIVTVNDYFSKLKFKMILAKYIKLYHFAADDLRTDQYFVYPLHNEPQGNYIITSGNDNINIGAVEVNDQSIDRLKTPEYIAELKNYQPDSLTDKIIKIHLPKALKSAIYEYNQLRPIPIFPSQNGKIMNMLMQHALPGLVTIINNFPVMEQFKKLYLNIKKVNKELAGIFLILIKFYKDVVMTLVNNIKPIARSIKDFAKACLIVIAPLVILPNIVTLKGAWRLLNLEIFVKMLEQVMGQINIGVGKLSNSLKTIKQTLETESNNAKARMDNRLDKTKRYIQMGATNVPKILTGPAAAAVSLSENASQNPAVKSMLGDNIMGAAQGTAKDVQHGVNRYIGIAYDVLGAPQTTYDEGAAIADVMGVGTTNSGAAEENDSDDELEKEIFGQDFDDEEFESSNLIENARIVTAAEAVEELEKQQQSKKEAADITGQFSLGKAPPPGQKRPKLKPKSKSKVKVPQQNEPPRQDESLQDVGPDLVVPKYPNKRRRSTRTRN